MRGRILISGASIAANTAAYWLGKRGFDVTVVEREPQFRDGGQNIDVRGVGREVLRRMGLEQSALDRGTGEEGTAWVKADGTQVARFAASDMDGDGGPTAEMEILRGDLARLLYEASRDQADYRFGDAIERIEEADDHVVVTFASGKSEPYALVIVAEGVGSSTRELVFPGENDPRWMNLTMAYFSIPRSGDDDWMWRWYNAPGRRSVSLRPDRQGRTHAVLSLWKPPEGEQTWDAAQQKAFLHDRFADVGWQTPRVLAGMGDANDFYFDVLRQVRMPRWSAGRIVLTGDAAWAVTPLGGIGATLALSGAYVLAEEWARHQAPVAAFSAYEQQMRPMVKERQNVPKIAPRLMHPNSRIGIRLLHATLGVVSRGPVSRVVNKLFSGAEQQPDLSRYESSSPTRPPVRPASGDMAP